MDRELTVWQAACIITGYSVGSGIMALPYLMTNAGLGVGIVIILAAFFFSYCMHMLLAELAMGARGNDQIVSIFSHYMVKGNVGKVVSAVSMVLVVLALFFAQAGFISGGADVLVAAGIPQLAAILLFYAVAAAVVFFGLKIIGVSESISVSVIIVVVAILAAGSLGHLSPIDIPTGEPSGILAFFGMTMFAFVAFFSIPQAVVGLGYDAAKVRRAVLLGLGINFVLIFVIVGCTLATSPEVTELAMIGWSAGIGLWAQVLGSVFTVLAMLTTYWSNSLACSDMIREQFGLGPRLCWLLATLPSLALVLFAGGGFIASMRLSSGLVAILIAIGLPIVVARAKRMNGQLYLVAPWMASTPMLVVLVAAFALMAVGSMI